ncbi:PREDICTED: RNA pseudouridylate synthase domain-containing protein 4, partial [Nanorana parkeri]|uniref:RNA pseudouridylate synthase domain-containing protein 4 n=1 Tax=Nanorana parkeri TaxID=125878 RepID=UPI000854FD63
MAAVGGARGARRLADRLRTEKRLAGKSQPPSPGPSLSQLRSWVIHREPDLVLINKPQGLATHGGPGVQHSLVSMLPALSQMLFGKGAEPLRICHRLDKDTSGALLLARSAEAADRVQRALREHRIHRVYWALCLGVPTPLDGIVDIPIIEKETQEPQKHYKMALCPRFRVTTDGSVQRFRISRSAHEAVTHYRTLEKALGVSLLELQPLTGVKHQLRSHMALGVG